MPTLEAPEERLRKFKYRGKDASVSMKRYLTLSRMGAVKSTWLKCIKTSGEWAGWGERASTAERSVWVSARMVIE